MKWSEVVSASKESPEYEQTINLDAEISQDQVAISSVSSDLQAMNTSNNVESEIPLPSRVSPTGGMGREVPPPH